MASPVTIVGSSGNVLAPAADGSLPATLAAGTAVIGKVSIDQTTPGTTNFVSADQTKQSSLVNFPPVATFTRPADATAYTVGDLVANSTTAGSVIPLSWTGVTIAGGAGSGEIRALHIYSSASVAQTIRAHFFVSSPTASTGDNAAITVTGLATYVGFVDVVLPANALNGGGSSGYTGNISVPYKMISGDTLFALLEAQTAFTPGNAAVYAVQPRLFRYS